MKLGAKILNLRKRKGLSQEELGEKINVTRQTISNWELGETMPNPEQLKLLSRELNVSIDELLDNDIQNILVAKVSNTEKLAGLILKIIKVFLITFFIIVIFLIALKIIVSNKDTGRKIEESIYCKIYGEEHGFSIVYEELTGKMLEAGGDTYFSDILNLGKYSDAHQTFNVINDYVKKNGGTCTMIKEKDLSDVVNMVVKEGTLTKTEATIIITENIDYDIFYGETFWIEKYDSRNNSWHKLSYKNNNCGFNLPAYGVIPSKPLVLKQNWSCMYGELEKGIYRLVKDVSFESDRPISEDNIYYIWVEFEIL